MWIIYVLLNTMIYVKVNISCVASQVDNICSALIMYAKHFKEIYFHL